MSGHPGLRTLPGKCAKGQSEKIAKIFTKEEMEEYVLPFTFSSIFPKEQYSYDFSQDEKSILDTILILHMPIRMSHKTCRMAGSSATFP